MFSLHLSSLKMLFPDFAEMINLIWKFGTPRWCPASLNCPVYSTRSEPPTPAHKLMPSSLFLSVVPVATFDPIGLFYMSLRNTVLRSGNIQ